MNRILFVVLYSIWFVKPLKTNVVNPLSDGFINSINALNTTWKAGRNFHSVIDYEFLRTLAGTYNNTPFDKSIKSLIVSNVTVDLPSEFDSRIKWPNCPTIREIRDQGSCGSCWVFAAVEAMSDRVCIHSSQSKHFHFSAENLLTCCHSCGNGCHGGSHKLAWNYWVEHGIVSGGSFDSKQGCQPYEFEPCEHHISGTRPNCTKYRPTPECVLSCQPEYKVSYQNDLHYGKIWYSLTNNEEVIKTEIFHNGPVEASMLAYEDFYVYKAGVYQHVKGNFIGGHAIKLIGWGTDEATNIPYWLVANSFNTDWGDHGYFKIKRGVNECDIESDVTAGIPL